MHSLQIMSAQTLILLVGCMMGMHGQWLKDRQASTDFDSKLQWLPHIRSFTTSTRKYRGADKFLAQPTSRCILFDG